MMNDDDGNHGLRFRILATGADVTHWYASAEERDRAIDAWRDEIGHGAGCSRPRRVTREQRTVAACSVCERADDAIDDDAGCELHPRDAVLSLLVGAEHVPVELVVVAGAMYPASGTMTVRLVGPRREVLRYRLEGEVLLEIIEVHRPARVPRPGDRLATWQDGSTVYAVAPVDGPEVQS